MLREGAAGAGHCWPVGGTLGDPGMVCGRSEGGAGRWPERGQEGLGQEMGSGPPLWRGWLLGLAVTGAPGRERATWEPARLLTWRSSQLS